MEKEETKKKALSEKQVFWIRFVCWSIFACIVPVVFIIWRYDLFTKITAIQFGGWGMLAIIIVATFLIVLANYIKKAFSKRSMTKQIISGICKVVLPLLTLLLVLYSIRNNIDLFLQALGCVIISESIAIPINPMPKRVYEESKGATEDAIDYFFQRYDEKNKKGD